jgi:hypothetical protein
MKQISFRLVAVGLIALAVSKVRAPFLHTTIVYGPTFVTGHLVEATVLIVLGLGLWRCARWWTRAYVALAIVTTIDGSAMILLATSEPQMMGGFGKVVVGLALSLAGIAARVAARIRQRQATA